MQCYNVFAMYLQKKRIIYRWYYNFFLDDKKHVFRIRSYFYGIRILLKCTFFYFENCLTAFSHRIQTSILVTLSIKDQIITYPKLETVF